MRIALIADTHLSVRAPECVANWHIAKDAVGRLGADLTVHLGDITLDGQSHADELGFASRLAGEWPTEMRCVPGNHDLGDGSGEAPLQASLMQAYADAFGPDHWSIDTGAWRLLGINAQLLGSGSAEEAALWEWIGQQASRPGSPERTALFLHRPVRRQDQGELARRGRYVTAAASERLLEGPLRPTLQLVVSGHTHQWLDTVVDGVRHVWMPSCAFVLPDAMQARVGEKVVGIAVLGLSADAARVDLWCPDGLQRLDVSTLQFFREHASRDEPV